MYIAVFMAQLPSSTVSRFKHALRCSYRLSRRLGLLLVCCGFVANNDVGPTLIKPESRTMVWLCAAQIRADQGKAERECTSLLLAQKKERQAERSSHARGHGELMAVGLAVALCVAPLQSPRSIVDCCWPGWGRQHGLRRPERVYAAALVVDGGRAASLQQSGGRRHLTVASCISLRKTRIFTYPRGRLSPSISLSQYSQ